MPWEVGGEKNKRELNGQSDIIILKEKNKHLNFLKSLNKDKNDTK